MIPEVASGEFPRRRSGPWRNSATSTPLGTSRLRIAEVARQKANAGGSGVRASAAPTSKRWAAWRSKAARILRAAGSRADDDAADRRKRDLQHEAKAHIEVQRWIDRGSLGGRAVASESIREIHRRFYELLPDDLLWVEDPDTHERLKVAPGELRRKADAIVSVAAAHHRLLWIHPFLDGNGRVARLMSHAMLLELLDTGGVWSVSRGLARNVAAYKAHLASCDLPRRNDLNGRGALSEEELARFTRFFLETCVDQVTFMEGLVQPDRLRARILIWAEEEAKLGELPAKAGSVLEAILFRGELPRGDVAGLLGATDRHARRTAAALVKRGVVTSDGQRAPLRLTFPAARAPRWMPGLFPEKPA